MKWCSFALIIVVEVFVVGPLPAGEARRPLSLTWAKEMLTIRGEHLPGGSLEVWYIEAFCRSGSTRRDWRQTVIPHSTELLQTDPGGQWIKLRSRLDDGVVVEHEIRTGPDEVTFRVVASNPTKFDSDAQWAQPCIRVDRYAGTKAERSSEAYLKHCFLYVDGKPARMPTTPWARMALYTPGQVWCPREVDRDDVNPRPLSQIVPSNGLIGCISADGRELVATAWEPYQELFQGVIVCLHSDFRIGGLKGGESKTILGKIYLMPADLNALRARYTADFPGQERTATGSRSSSKALIEFGWDEPNTDFLRRERAQLERTPFDGCVFHVEVREPPRGAPENFSWLCWGKRRFTQDQLKPAMEDLGSITSTKFRRNFLRFNVTPADLDWFDDYEAIVTNARLAAAVARAGPCAGILLDTEQYQGKLFNYRQQRDAARRTWSEYSSQARKRGREVMQALQEGFPDLTVLLTFGHSLVWKQSDGGKTAIADCKDGLLVPFLDGMIEGCHGRAHLVDGHEMSYGYREPAAFAHAYAAITREAAAFAADRASYHRLVSAGFGLWLDYDWPKEGWNTDEVDRNHFSPGRFESSLRAAIEQSDEYVWIYTEKPRWWSQQGGPIALPRDYVETLRRVRSALLAD